MVTPPIVSAGTGSDAGTAGEGPRAYPPAWQRRFVTSKDGLPLVIRPMRADDEPRMIAFHTGLSEQTVYWRYFRTMPLMTRIAHDRLITICRPDLRNEAVLVAEWADPVGQRHIIGVGRLADLPRADCEYAVLVADAWQGRGVGRQLLAELMSMARFAGRKRLVADILPNNTHMQRMVEKLGFTVTYDLEDRVMKSSFELT